MHALRCFLTVRRQFQPVLDVDTANDEHIILFFDFARGLGHQPAFASRNVTRLQRATKGARQSAGGRGNDVVEGCRMWLVLTRFCTVMGVDGRVLTE